MNHSRPGVIRRHMLLGLLGCAAGLAPRARADLPPTREPFLTDAWLDGLEDAFLKPRQTADDRPARVLFLGNSITLNHDVPARVAAWATRAGARIDVAMAAASGARLRETAQIARLRRLLRGGTWEILVLQDYTTMPFHAGERAASARTMAQLADLAQPEQVVLYPPWPRAPRHRFYSRAPAFLDLIPRGPAEFAEATMDFYGEVAQANGFAVAPVPEVWMQAVADQRPVYDQDNYHASAEGASLAARVIWQQLERGLAELA